MLLECRADTGLQDIMGRTPLQCTSSTGPRDVVQLLLDYDFTRHSTL